MEITEVSSLPISEELKKRCSHHIRKVYKIVPLVSPKCSREIHIVSFIDQVEVIKKVLEHLGLWEESHAPPNRDPPKNESLLILRIAS